MEVPAGQVNLRGSFRRLASNVLEPMFHPECIQIDTKVQKVYKYKNCHHVLFEILLNKNLSLSLCYYLP